MIAKIIVDVPANQTDRLFDYGVPEKWEDLIEPGMRVVVPFGPRKVQGFVVDLVEETELEKVRNIQDMMDVDPVLTPELIELGFWLTDETLCFAVSAFQAMLPAAMKANYKKKIVVAETFDGKLAEEVSRWFEHRNEIPWEDIKDSQVLPIFKKEIKRGALESQVVVKEKTAPKTQAALILPYPKEELESRMEELNDRAVKQKEVLSLFYEINAPIAIPELIELADTTRGTIKSLVQKGLLKQIEQEIYRDPYKFKSFKPSKPLDLTEEQRKAVEPIMNSLDESYHNTFLLQGVTGSGKTEIYLQTIAHALNQGKEAIVLVPEISLTPQMVSRFKGRFGSDVAVMHSGLSKGEKYDEWRKIHRGEVKVVVGARSAVFAPFKNLGIIIIDEEHESSYKQEETPRYHARDVAIKRAKYHRCPVVLGSATPALESFARAQKQVYTLLQLKERVNKREMPDVEIVDMREELRSGNRSMFSKPLFDKLIDRLEKGEQSVLLLNRRGYSTFLICRDCGYVLDCPHCDISLTYHKINHMMKCHYCGYEQRAPKVCPNCTSEHIRFFGTGTQRVEEELAKILPDARVIRMDVDTTRRKGAHEKLLGQFGDGKADILLGTQMIAKGLDFEKVTLVGVLAADAMLHLPDFRASERTFQLLTQVSGRAGRHELHGEVVIQTYTPEHYSIQYASHHDFDSFYVKEMQARKLHGYPPFYYITLINISHEEITKVLSVTEKITNFLKANLSENSIVLGPVASAIPRIKDRYRYQCMIKYKVEPDLNRLLKEILKRFSKELTKDNLQITIDRNPHMLM
ncbi:primosomal protein N' [Pseudalkalibacillus caeni]|uniref:Replication restart protein PriA n=1 Tax=Exobacillus caeni TaxID=2574798 RepID=A0A5R9FCD3_9BACL|nr:primosomal protein N' [Pseudalkalibacillus caeni]TLS37315.1 primosomal protein N' [Pseudalkalibacillus caeni]